MIELKKPLVWIAFVIGLISAGSYIAGQLVTALVVAALF